MPKLFMLVGLPAAGKSTLRQQIADVHPGLIVASSDDYIEKMSKDEGKTYNQGFKDHVKGGENHVKALASFAVKEQRDIIWDQTNLTIQKRQRALSFFPSHWEKEAIVVRCKDFEEWKQRLMSRPGKTIPVEIIQSMMKNFVMPTTEEGFTSIAEFWT